MQGTLRETYRAPDWEFYERHLGRPVPPALKRLYETKDFSMHPIVEIEGREYYFHPIRESQIVAESVLGHGVLKFAETELSEPVYLKPGADNHGNTVYYLKDNKTDAVLFDDISDLVRLAGAARDEPGST
ncbi:MAG: hypothetical protein R3286_14905 [Gammaproteobacteria bacterium]|nr:hypothetical protein [Gammaproteobacteria bacterium]